MTISYIELLKARFDYISTAEAAKILGITPLAASRLVRQGKIPGVKMGGSYMVARGSVREFAKSYVPHRGRPRMKRKYTKRGSQLNNT